MQTPIATFTATAQRYPLWLKNVVTATFLLLFVKGAIWAGAAWLAFRGIYGL